MDNEKFYYAELNEDGICMSVSDLAGEVVADTMIRIPEYDVELLGKKYVNGAWEEAPQEELPEPEPEETVTWGIMAEAISEGVNEV